MAQPEASKYLNLPKRFPKPWRGQRSCPRRRNGIGLSEQALGPFHWILTVGLAESHRRQRRALQGQLHLRLDRLRPTLHATSCSSSAVGVREVATTALAIRHLWCPHQPKHRHGRHQPKPCTAATVPTEHLSQFSEDTTRRPQPASAVEVFDLSRRSLKDGAPGARAHVIRIRSGFYPLLDKCTTMNRTRAWSTAVHVWCVDDLTSFKNTAIQVSCDRLPPDKLEPEPLLEHMLLEPKTAPQDDHFSPARLLHWFYLHGKQRCRKG